MASWPKLPPSVSRPPEITESCNFGFWGFLYRWTNVESFIKFGEIDFQFSQKVAELAWNDPDIERVKHLQNQHFLFVFKFGMHMQNWILRTFYSWVFFVSSLPSRVIVCERFKTWRNECWYFDGTDQLCPITCLPDLSLQPEYTAYTQKFLDGCLACWVLPPLGSHITNYAR